MRKSILRFDSTGHSASSQAASFCRACNIVHFGARHQTALWARPRRSGTGRGGLRRFAIAAILETELAGRRWLVGDKVSYADFRMATFLPFNDAARLPLGDYPAVSRWYGRLEAIDAWRDPFQGLDAPALAPIPGQLA